MSYVGEMLAAFAAWGGGGHYSEVSSPKHIPESSVCGELNRRKSENRFVFKNLRNVYNTYKAHHGLTTNKMAKTLGVTRSDLRDVLSECKLHQHVLDAIANLENNHEA